MTKPANNTTPAKGKPAAAKKDAAANPATKTPEQIAADAAAIAKAKADQKAKDDAAKAEAKAKKEAEAAAKKAEKEAAAAAKKAEKEAAAAAKAAELEAGKAAREEALAKIKEAEQAVEAAQDTLDQAKADLKALRQAARVPGAVGEGSTAILRAKAATYVHDKEHKTAAGNASVHCNDPVAQKLLGKTLDECYTIAAEVCAPDMDEAALRAKYGHLNVGMQRMNLGNKMRGVLNAK